MVSDSWVSLRWAPADTQRGPGQLTQSATGRNVCCNNTHSAVETPAGWLKWLSRSVRDHWLSDRQWPHVTNGKSHQMIFIQLIKKLKCTLSLMLTNMAYISKWKEMLSICIYFKMYFFKCISVMQRWIFSSHYSSLQSHDPPEIILICDPWSTNPVLSRWGIFVAIAKNTL